MSEVEFASKTTINISRDVHRKLKVESAKREKEVGELAEDCIENCFPEKEEPECIGMLYQITKNDFEQARKAREIMMLKHNCEVHDDQEACEKRQKVEGDLDRFATERLSRIRKFREKCTGTEDIDEAQKRVKKAKENVEVTF